MHPLTPEGQGIVDDLARRHGFSRDAILHMLCALRQGNGSMAMFSHPEFGGPGQWMYGGTPMLSDALNHSLRRRVDALCHELSERLANQPALLDGGHAPPRDPGHGGDQAPASGDATSWAGPFAPAPDTPWWPAELGTPTATGSQDGLRYAYFAEARRLAIQRGDRVRVHDTREHRITGIATQQQGANSSVTFTSQSGQVDLASLPVISSHQPSDTRPSAPADAHEPAPGVSVSDADPACRPDTGYASGSSQEAELLNAIERLGELRDKGVLTEEEFSAKKAELLSRL